MKIVACSNFGKETVDDKLVAENLSKLEAYNLCRELNASRPDNDKYYNKVVEDDYILYTWEP